MFYLHINDLIDKPILRTKTPAAKKPVGLIRTNGKRPDGTALIPMMRCKLVAWDITIIYTFADSYILIFAQQHVKTRSIAEDKAQAMVAGALLYPDPQHGIRYRCLPANNHGQFRSRLKTELFNRAYHVVYLSKQDFSEALA